MSLTNTNDSSSVTWQTKRQRPLPPDLRFLHFNDVYHIEYSEQRPCLYLDIVVLISVKDQDRQSLSGATPGFSTWSINTVTVLNTKVNQTSSHCFRATPSILVWKAQ